MSEGNARRRRGRVTNRMRLHLVLSDHLRSIPTLFDRSCTLVTDTVLLRDRLILEQTNRHCCGKRVSDAIRGQKREKPRKESSGESWVTHNHPFSRSLTDSSRSIIILASPNRRCEGETVIAETCPLWKGRAGLHWVSRLYNDELCTTWTQGKTGDRGEEKGNSRRRKSEGCNWLPFFPSSFRLTHNCQTTRWSLSASLQVRRWIETSAKTDHNPLIHPLLLLRILLRV